MNAAESCFVEVIFELVLCGTFAVDNKGLAYLSNVLTRTKVVYHLAVVAMTRESFYFANLCTNTVIITKDTDKSQVGILNACS